MTNQPGTSKERGKTLVRRAGPGDADTILTLVDGLARYERLPPPDSAAQARLVRDMFSDPPRIQAFLALHETRPAGYAFIFETYSSFLALPTLFLEDIFVLEEFRGRGVGLALFRTVVGEAHRRGCGRMEWAVLDWNKLAIDFYQRMGARHLNDWQLFRLARTDMEKIITRPV